MSERYELTGGKTSAVIFGNYPDTAELQQLYAMMNCPAFGKAQIRIMPDHHAGKGCVVGFTCPYTDKAVPNIVGVDIGCGVSALNIGKRTLKDNEFKAFDRYLRDNVPSGFSGRETQFNELKLVYSRFIDPMGRITWATFITELNKLAAKVATKENQVWCSLGTLGGGNHFIELGRHSETEDVYLTVHSGSRNFGLKVCTFHQKLAQSKVGPKQGLEWLEGEDAEAYLKDMRIAQKFAELNRMTMLTILAKHFDVKLKNAEMISSVHNFIGEDNIIRKGAISAKKGELVIIPWTMKDGLILGEGKGNPDWNNSAPHGAGRIMSRGDAKRTLTLTDYKATMEGIWTSCVSRDTLDEAPPLIRIPPWWRLLLKIL